MDIESNTRIVQGTTRFKLRSLEETGVFQVPVIEATHETLKGYGTLCSDFENETVEIVTWPQSGWRAVLDGTGNEGGVTEGEFHMEWRGDTIHTFNHAVGRGYITGWSTDPYQARSDRQTSPRDCIYVFEANYHPDGGQIFFAKNKTPFIALLALPGDDIVPEDFVAFYCDGKSGLNIHPGVWHAPVFPCQDKEIFLDRQGKVHACVPCNFVTEFGVYLKIPLNIINR